MKQITISGINYNTNTDEVYKLSYSSVYEFKKDLDNIRISVDFDRSLVTLNIKGILIDNYFKRIKNGFHSSICQLIDTDNTMYVLKINSMYNIDIKKVGS